MKILENQGYLTGNLYALFRCGKVEVGKRKLEYVLKILDNEIHTFLLRVKDGKDWQEIAVC